MNITFFSVLSTKSGYKFATFETKEERKVIEGFDRIPYTPETLLEDILFGFPAFPDYRKTNKINNEFENSIQWLLTANNCWFDNIQLDIYPFCEPVFIKTFENGIHCYINAETKNNAEMYFYNELILKAKEMYKDLDISLIVAPVDEFMR